MTYLRSVLFDLSNMSAFGTLETAELTPVFQSDFVYGTNTQLWNTANYTGTGALVDTDTARLRIQCGTTNTGYAYITSRRILRYRAGQGTVVRMTPIFATGTANNIQLWGAGSISSNLPQDGFFFGYNGTAFGIAHYNRGTGTWTSQGSWNGDHCLAGDGSFAYNSTLGTPAMIKYPYLGYGDIEFFLQNPDTTRWVLVHNIKYANTSANTELGNPSLQLMGYTFNSGNTTNRIMYMGSVGAFISGIRLFIGNPKWSAKNNKASITTETNLLTLKNATTYNGITNRGLIRLTNISLGSSAASGAASFDLVLNPTLGGSPSFSARNGSTADNGVTITSGNSIASFDTAGTTITGGTQLFSVSMDNPDSAIVDLTPYDIFLAPGDTLSIAGTSSNNATMTASLNWNEDI